MLKKSVLGSNFRGGQLALERIFNNGSLAALSKANLFNQCMIFIYLFIQNPSDWFIITSAYKKGREFKKIVTYDFLKTIFSNFQFKIHQPHH